MQKNWESSFLPGFEENEGTIEFKTYEELLSGYGLTNLVSETNFNEWFQTFKSNDGLPFTTASEYYQELRICASLTKDEYENLGERQSSLPRTDVRITFYALYQQYFTR